MTPLFKKLNFKGQEEILVINHPSDFGEELTAMSDVTAIYHDFSLIESIQFCLIFVTEQKEIDSTMHSLASKLAEDAVLWYSYPKKSSKKYSCNFSRDSGWEVLGQYGHEGVRMVAIDDNWSAIRFRHVDHIKSITRDKSWILSKEGKIKASKNK